MNRVKFNLTINTATEKTFTYNVLFDNTVIYTGKLFVLPSQPNIKLDLTDILGNYQYNGAGIMTPTWNLNRYSQPTASTTVLGTDSMEQHFRTVVVKVYDGDTLKATATDNVFFHTTPFNKATGISVSNNSTYFGSMVPRMPFIYTSELRYGQLIYNSMSSFIKFISADGTVLYQSPSVVGSTVHNVSLSDLYWPAAENGVYFNNRKILEFDKCAAPYYLCWITSDGGFQCQPFISSSVYTEETSKNNKVSSDDMTDVANSIIKGKWKLKSRNINEREYNEMMDIARSPYLLLFDSFLGKSTFVNVTDTSVEEKKFRNNNKKPLYFEVNVESREQINNII